MEGNRIETKNKLNEGLEFKISAFKKKIKKTIPHKHDDYFEIIMLQKGEGFHRIEEKQYQIAAPEFYILRPGQLHYWQFTSIPEGFVIMFKKSFFDLTGDYGSLNLFEQLAARVQGKIPDADYPDSVLNLMLEAYESEKVYSSHILNGLLKALVGHLLNISQWQINDVGATSLQYEKFRQLLNSTGRYRKVNYYAEKLHTTPQNLTNICKKQCNKTASELINRHILLEAKRYVLHTDNTINEIAYQLNFSDVSNFVKFFKRIEGMTPIQYRKQYFQ
ncbi:MAG: helix-turn-helix transcriptional regulator [Cytophagales bacterium]|nr:helix-turn-helix transcriptional regulator [Cytophagales bacterium]